MEGAQQTSGERPFADAVRWPIDADTVRLRLSDRFMQRLHATRRRLAPRMLAELPGSTLRRWLITRATAAGWAAFDNGDYAFMKGAYAPDVVFKVAGDVFIDLPSEARGWAEVRRMMENLLDGFAVSDQRPVEIIDLGGRHFVVRIEGRLTGIHSGLDVVREFVYMYEIAEEGVAARQWVSDDMADIEAFYLGRLRELERSGG